MAVAPRPPIEIIVRRRVDGEKGASPVKWDNVKWQ
jgi:hypothetical protein